MKGNDPQIPKMATILTSVYGRYGPKHQFFKKTPKKRT